MKDNSELFLKGLNAIRNRAALQNGTVEVSDVLGAFSGMELSDEQIGLVYDFLDREGIHLADYVPREEDAVNVGALADEVWGGADSEADEKLYEFYEADLAGIAPLSSREEKELEQALLSGGEKRNSAAQRLAEGNLRWVVQLAREYSGRGVPLADLIQEGNLALWSGIVGFEGGELEDILEKDIRGAMKALLKEQGSYAKAEDNLVSLANRVLDTVKEMEEETGEAVSAAEISKRLGLPESRVDEVLRQSAKAMKNVER